MFGRSKKEPDLQLRRRSISPPTANAPAFSYHANRSARPDGTAQGRAITTLPNITSAKSSHKARRITILALLTVVLGAILWELSINSAAKIVIVEPNGFSYLPHSLKDYQSAVSQAMDSSIYNRFKLTVSSNDIASQLEKKFPEISHAAVTVAVIGRTPKVYLQLAKPALIYSSPAGSYLLNVNGVVVAKSNILPKSESSALATVSSSSTVNLTDGDQVLTSNNVDFIQTVKAALAAKNITIVKMDLIPEAEELDLYPAGVSYYVKFNIYETDSLQQVGTYLATIATLKQQNQTPSQYIDVRVDGRAYYK